MKINRLPRYLILMVFTAVVTGCGLLPTKVAATPEALPTYTPQPTYTTLPTYTIPAPVNETPLPPTMAQVTETPELTATATVLYSVQVTFSPTPTMSGVWIRIRNRTQYDVNLYRYGRSGELHFLGWLVPGYYAEFRFPSLGEWRIKYCYRDTEGESHDCHNKWIEIKRNQQEFAVP